ncbi:VOC family protein [Phormidium tenue FACHB-886]|nr:VOC family protein [Phormidium tenue FACHB-886]
MEPYISMITLGVSDLVRSTAFYKQGLGLPAKQEFDDVTFLNLRGTWLALYSREALAADAQISAAGNGFPGFTLAHNVKSKKSVNYVLEQAKAAGATILKPGQDTSWGGYSGYFTDPDSYLWEVA